MWWSVLGVLGAGLLGAAVVLSVDYFFLSSDTLADAVREEEPDAFKVLIKEKKKNAVNVGIFDEDNEHLNDMEITTSKGVSRSLRKGQTIYV